MFKVFGRTGPPILGGHHLGPGERTRDAVTRCFCEHTVQQMRLRLGFRPGLCWGAYSVPSGGLALVGFMGLLRDGKGRRKRGKEREVNHGEGRLTLYEQGRRLAKAGLIPALIRRHYSGRRPTIGFFSALIHDLLFLPISTMESKVS